MPRLIALQEVAKIADLAFNINEDPSRAETDQALIDAWKAQYGEANVFLVEDPDVRAEPGDTWDGNQGIAPPAQPEPPGLAVVLKGSQGEVPQNANKHLLFTSEPRVGSEVVYGTHNYSDPTTWFGASVRAVGEEAIDEGAGTTWSLAHNNVIDMVHGKIFDEVQYIADQQEENPEDPHGYAVVVKVNGIAKEMREPFAISGGDYEVDYAAGKITFFASQSGQTVTVDYSYAESSVFVIKPDAGFNLDIEKAKAIWADNFVMNDAVLFEVHGYASVFAPQLGLPAGTKILIQTTVYRTLTQLSAEAAGYWPFAVPATGGTTRGISSPRHIIEFRYGTIRRLASAYGIELHIRLKDNVPMGGEHTSATFYCTVREA